MISSPRTIAVTGGILQISLPKQHPQDLREALVDGGVLPARHLFVPPYKVYRTACFFIQFLSQIYHNTSVIVGLPCHTSLLGLGLSPNASLQR
jgi:hypothetical protein